MPRQIKSLFRLIPRVRGYPAPAVFARWCRTSIGSLLIAEDGEGICFIGLEVEGARTRAEDHVHAKFPGATFVKKSTPLIDHALDMISFLYQGGLALRTPLPLTLHGTDFQIKVWRALMGIPFGTLVTYGEIAKKMGAPAAARAVGSAIGSNPVSIFVPCHRVIGTNGNDGLYGWGRDAKMSLIQKEAQI